MVLHIHHKEYIAILNVCTPSNIFAIYVKLKLIELKGKNRKAHHHTHIYVILHLYQNKYMLYQHLSTTEQQLYLKSTF